MPPKVNHDPSLSFSALLYNEPERLHDDVYPWVCFDSEPVWLEAIVVLPSASISGCNKFARDRIQNRAWSECNNVSRETTVL